MAATPFNPYLKWLGIPLKDQPPNHYRLLGIELLESDPDIIQRAVDRQMTYLRSLQSGKHAALAQQLLNEISAAKVCLLNADKKADYDQTLQIDAQEKGLRPKAAPAIGELSGSSSSIHSVAPPIRSGQPAAKAPPPPRRPSASSSGVGLKTAQPLEDVTPTAGQAAVAPVITAISAKPAGNGATKAAPAIASPTGGSMVPILAAAGAGGAMLLLLGALLAFFLWPSSDGGGSAEVAQSGGETNQQHQSGSSGGTRSSGSQAANTGRNTGNSVGGTNGNSGNTSGGNSNDGNPTTGVIPNGGTSNTAVTNSRAQLAVDAPFLVRTLSAGKNVLSDRDYTFTNVDRELQELDFTHWPYGPIESFKFDVERAGTVYLIIPPKGYSQPLPAVVVPGWEKTDITCDVRLDDGRKLPCLVYKREADQGSATMPANSSIWPILAAKTIVKPTRTFGEIVNNGSNNTGNGGRNNPGGNPGGNSTPPPDGSGGNNTDGSDNAGSDSTNNPPKRATRLTVPSSEDQAPIRAQVVKTFELSERKPIEDTLGDARQLLEVGREPSENPTERYVLLATAARLAAESGDLSVALDAVSVIEKEYEADTASMRIYLADRFVKSRAPANVKRQQLHLIAHVLDEGLNNDHFEAVDNIVADLVKQKVGNQELTERRRIAREMRKVYQKVATAKETLASSPDDGTANRIVGEYFCYHKLNWTDGLPMLAKADDPDVRKAATMELADPEKGPEQFEVAQAWWSIAQSVAKDDTQVKGALLTHAEDWYRKAHSDVTGLTAAATKNKLEEIAKELEKIGWVDIPRTATIVGRSGYGFEMYLNGKQIIGFDYYDIGSAQVQLKRGDVLVVRATRSTFSSSSSGKGFACVIAFEGSNQPIVTGVSRGWNGYVPANPSEWYNLQGGRTVPVQFSIGSGHQDLYQQTGQPARSMWYAGTNSSEAYFIFRLP